MMQSGKTGKKRFLKPKQKGKINRKTQLLRKPYFSTRAGGEFGIGVSGKTSTISSTVHGEIKNACIT